MILLHFYVENTRRLFYLENESAYSKVSRRKNSPLSRHWEHVCKSVFNYFYKNQETLRFFVGVRLILIKVLKYNKWLLMLSVLLAWNVCVYFYKFSHDLPTLKRRINLKVCILIKADDKAIIWQVTNLVKLDVLQQ